MFEDGKVPMSQIMTDIITFYKYGGKQLYYNNTYDGAGEMKEDEPVPMAPIDDEACESCVI